MYIHIKIARKYNVFFGRGGVKYNFASNRCTNLVGNILTCQLSINHPSITQMTAFILYMQELN